MAVHQVVVEGVPDWVDAGRLLGPGPWSDARASLSTRAAADLAARLRGVVLGGSTLVLRVTPRLPRAAVRAARSDEARRMRDRTAGFLRSGTRVDEEGRVSLTPEVLALALGRRAAGRRVLDLCCGCGGNAIGFARAGCQVLAVDANAARLRLARHNAGCYGVSDVIEFRCARAVQVNLELDALVFCDPPWGEVGRASCQLSDFPVLEGLVARRPTGLWAKLPPAFAPSSWPGAVPEAVFGEAAGDRRRVKFLLLRV